jgi:glycosyltransferase involved in cell wall biosynthesis
LSKLVVADTATHAQHFETRVHARVGVARIGSAVELERAELLAAGPAPFEGVLRLVHYGNFFPIQGVDVILEALKQLDSEVELDLIGRSDFTDPLPNNVKATGRLPTHQLFDRLASAHAMLGQFGSTDQQRRVVPTKVYDALAIGIPVITAANSELAIHADDFALRLVQRGDASALAGAIRSLARDAHNGVLPQLGVEASRLYQAKFSIAQSRDDWLRIIRSLS